MQESPQDAVNSAAFAARRPMTRSLSAHGVEECQELEAGHMTRSRVREIAGKLVDVFKYSAVKIGCMLHPLVKAALDKELEREAEGVGDLEPGQELSYVPIISPAPVASCLSNTSTVSIPRTKTSVRRVRRLRSDAAKTPAGTIPVPKIRSSLSKRLQGFSVIRNDFAVSKLPTARGAYIGLRRARGKHLKSVEALLAEGYTYVPWDASETVVLEGDDGAIAGALVGFPKSDTYAADVKEVVEAVTQAGKEMKFSKAENSRGSFNTIAVGVSYGGGQMLPGNLRHSEHNMAVINRLIGRAAMIRIAHLQSAAFASLAPKLWKVYNDDLGKIFARLPGLRRLFSKSVFTAASFNFGPRAVTCSHADHANRAIGWCAIFAAGKYDPTRGGHIVLESFKLIIEFPPGAIVLIPSATCVHSNTPIRRGETRIAFTQYAAGGLFRFVDYGFRTWKNIVANDPQGAKEIKERRKTRLEEELRLYSHVDSLHADRVACGISK